MASLIYSECLYALATGALDFEGGSFRVMLTDASYVPDRAKHRHRSDVSGEIKGAGYTPGGAPVAVSVKRLDGGGMEIALGGAAWMRATINARTAIYYHADSDVLVAAIEQDNVIRSSNGNWTLNTSLIRLADR